MKKLPLALCTLPLAALCACGADSSLPAQGSAGGVLNVCVDGTGANEMLMDPIFAEFEAQNPGVTLHVEYTPAYKADDAAMLEERTAALARLRTELMGGQGADVYLFFDQTSASNPDGYMLFPDLERTVQSGVLHDLDFLFEDSRFQAEDYVPGLRTLGVCEGKTYLLPLSYTASVLVGVEPALQESGFPTGAAGMTAFVEGILALDDAQRPYWSTFSSPLLLDAAAEPPVSLQKAAIQLNEPGWQQVLQLARTVQEQCGPEADFFEAINFEAGAASGAAILPSTSVRGAAYAARVLEGEGYTARLLPLPNEDGGVTARPYLAAAVSAGCRNTEAAASLLLHLLGETVQGCQTLQTSGSPANMYFHGFCWPVRRGCSVKMLEQLSMQPVVPGPVSDTLRADAEALESRVDTFRIGTRYDAGLYTLVRPYLNGEQTWEECYAAIEKEWSYLDE